MNILNKFSKIFATPKVVQKRLGLSGDSLDIDILSEVYSLSMDRVGLFLESELGWRYQASIALSPSDLHSDIAEESNSKKYSAIILTDGKSKKRFITSNPDLILDANKEFDRYSKGGYSFEISSRVNIDLCRKKHSVINEVLKGIDVKNRISFSVFVISLLDCLELGAREVTYGNGKYKAQCVSENYEGIFSSEMLQKTIGQLSLIGGASLGNLLRQLGFSEEVKLDIQSDYFRVYFGEDKLVSIVQEKKVLKHVLLVDDDQRFVEILKRGISAKGFRVSIASTAKQAIEYLNTSGVEVDLVISDFHMPNFSGATLITEIRKIDQNLPIIGLTGDAQSDSYVSFINAGANVIVRKSDDPKVLFAWIYKFVDEDFHLKVA